MVPYFPKQFSSRAIFIYIISLAIVSVVFMNYMLKPAFIIISIIWVLLFFLLSNRYSKKWLEIDEKTFIRKIFLTALVLRLIWVVFSYFFYLINTGIPFEFGSSDALAYHQTAIWLKEIGWSNAMDYLFTGSYSDAGYPLYLTLLYSIIGPNILVTRILKTIFSSWTCILVYKLAKRNFGEEAGRMAGIFCVLCPNLVIYCGMHLKETEMIFLTMAALERLDNILRQKHANILNIVVSALLVISLFFFRTVLGAAVIFSFFTSLVFSSTAVMTKSNRMVLIIWAVIAVAVMAGGTIANEVEGYWESRGSNQDLKRSQQVNKGVEWAKYATGTVMAPMIFVLPFPTMVDVDEQYNQQMVNAGNYVRNFMGIFVLIALYSAIFKKKNWRDFSLIGAFVMAYLGIISTSGFANSERFLLPGFPILLMIAAYGITQLNAKNYRFVKIWFLILPVMIMAWAFFKLGSRGLS